MKVDDWLILSDTQDTIRDAYGRFEKCSDDLASLRRELLTLTTSSLAEKTQHTNSLLKVGLSLLDLALCKLEQLKRTE